MRSRAGALVMNKYKILATRLARRIIILSVGSAKCFVFVFDRFLILRKVRLINFLWVLFTSTVC